MERDRRHAEQRPFAPSPSGGQVAAFVRSAAALAARAPASRTERRAMTRNKILPALEDRAAVTAYKILRTRVLHRMRSNRWQTLIVTGAGPGEGKTLTACNLALGIADDVNQSVMLVDLDLQKPMVARNFGLHVRAGLGDFLTGRARIDDIVHVPDGMERIALVPNRIPIANSSDLIATPRMREFLEWVRGLGRTTITIFDMPPVLSCDDVLAFAPYADAVLLVVSERATEREPLARALDIIGEENLIGVVLNRSRERNAKTYYY